MPDKIDKAIIVTSSVAGALAVAGVSTKVIGFTSAGIAAGSKAAVIQAGIGSVAANSAFATVQSLAASGLISTITLMTGIGFGVCLTYIGITLYKNLKKSSS